MEGVSAVDGVHRIFVHGAKRFCLSVIVLRHTERLYSFRPRSPLDSFELAFHLTDTSDAVLENGWWEARVTPSKLLELGVGLGLSSSSSQSLHISALHRAFHDPQTIIAAPLPSRTGAPSPSPSTWTNTITQDPNARDGSIVTSNEVRLYLNHSFATDSSVSRTSVTLVHTLVREEEEDDGMDVCQYLRDTRWSRLIAHQLHLTQRLLQLEARLSTIDTELFESRDAQVQGRIEPEVKSPPSSQPRDPIAAKKSVAVPGQRRSKKVGAQFDFSKKRKLDDDD
eukprot:c16638_g1_i2.p1 GENE.c16638_g1_i2~~c16638_g1_i2.p1  ORF type:complete len:282 (+),score=46.48 c16638_g1_i2:38-883(+)